MSNKILEFFEEEEFKDKWGFFEKDGGLFVKGNYYFIYVPEKDMMLGYTPVHANEQTFYTPKTPNIENIYLRKYVQLPVNNSHGKMQTVAAPSLIKYIPKDSNPLGEEWLMGGLVLNTKEGTCYVPSAKEYSFRICIWIPNSSST